MNDQTAPISAFIICKNEIEALGPCLDSLDFCREIVIVDSGSDDGTLDLIEDYRKRGYPIRLFGRDWLGYARQKQFALDQCREEWCVNLDSDERLDAELREAIMEIVSGDGAHAAWKMRRREWLSGYGYAHPLAAAKSHIRLVRRSRAAYDTARSVHESLKVDGSVGNVKKGWLLHRHRASVEADLDKQNRYTSLKAQERLDRERRARPWKMLSAPIAYFLKFYLLKRYFLCGWAGFAHAALSAQYAFQTELKHWHATVQDDREAAPREISS